MSHCTGEDPKEKPSAFIHSELDDFGLTTLQFRVFCHIVRRGERGTAFPGLPSMAAVCKVGVTSVRSALKELTRMKLIGVKSRPGTSNVYTINERSKWIPAKSATPSKSKRATPTESERSPLQNPIEEGNPKEGNPKEGKEGGLHPPEPPAPSSSFPAKEFQEVTPEEVWGTNERKTTLVPSKHDWRAKAHEALNSRNGRT